MIAEHVGEHSVWVRDSFVDFGSSDDRLSSLDSGGEYCFFCVVRSQYDR